MNLSPFTRQLFTFVVTIIAAALITSCSDNTTGSDNGDGNGNGDTIENVSFSSTIQPIFDQSCGSGACHINSSQNGVNLSNYQNVINSEGQQYGRLIVDPGDADNSPLYDKIASSDPENGSRMPRGGSPLSDTKIEQVRVWINEGANNN